MDIIEFILSYINARIIYNVHYLLYIMVYHIYILIRLYNQILIELWGKLEQYRTVARILVIYMKNGIL